MKSLPWTAWIPALLICCGLEGCESPAETASAGKTIGLVLSGYDYQMYTSKDGKEECPDGLVFSSKDNWHVQFPTKAARKAHYDRCGAIDNRGPDCAHVLTVPDLVKDPLPYREVRGQKSYGLNLDGDEDGRGTDTTCAHPNFVSPEGKAGVDNQYYRLLGCQKFVHSDLLSPDAMRQNIASARGWRLLMEIRGIDDMRNDADVQVLLYQGRSPLVVDAANKAIPWQTQRIDEEVPPKSLRGRIVEGELITDPVDMIWRNVVVFGMNALVRGSQLHLRLTGTGAEGLRTGYIDAADWWRGRQASGFVGSFTGDSPPSLYAALYRLADGYKDPKTGVCTALSSSAKLEFVRSHIARGTQGERS